MLFKKNNDEKGIEEKQELADFISSITDSETLNLDESDADVFLGNDSIVNSDVYLGEIKNSKKGFSIFIIVLIVIAMVGSFFVGLFFTKYDLKFGLHQLDNAFYTSEGFSVIEKNVNIPFNELTQGTFVYYKSNDGLQIGKIQKVLPDCVKIEDLSGNASTINKEKVKYVIKD